MRTLIPTLLTGLLAVSSSLAQNLASPELFGATQTRTFPYSMIGQLIFTSGDSDYQGSGTVVYKRSVLTAAHNLWDADSGWSYHIEFNRARVGRDTAKQTFSTRSFVLGGYQSYAGRFGPDSVRAFAYDMGGLRFADQPADGSYAGWKADLRLVMGNTYNICLGYGASVHSGDDLLFVEPSDPFTQTYNAFFENTSLTFEGGMSGGPVFARLTDGSLRVAGIVVAGSDDPPSGGIRGLNPLAGQFISVYLHY
jgi:hypothetical protein